MATTICVDDVTAGCQLECPGSILGDPARVMNYLNLKKKKEIRFRSLRNR